MKKYIVAMTVVITVLVVMLGLGVANYFTCFAYFLPHRPALIELAPQDTLIEVHPEWIAVPGGFNQTRISLNWTKGIGANTTVIRASNETALDGGTYDWITPQELLERPIASLTLWELNVLVDYCATKANANPDLRSTKWPIMTTVYQNQIIITLLYLRGN